MRVFQGAPTPHFAGTPLIRLGAIAPIHLPPQGRKEKSGRCRSTFPHKGERKRAVGADRRFIPPPHHANHPPWHKRKLSRSIRGWRSLIRASPSSCFTAPTVASFPSGRRPLPKRPA